MIDIRHIASGSSGNCIALNDGTSTIVLDAGLSYSKLSQKIKFSEVELVLCGHIHQDHFKSIPELVRRGVDVYGNEEVVSKIGMNGGNVIEKLNQIETANWLILPFDVTHDVENYGFLLQSKNTREKILYAVDTSHIDYSFQGVNYFLLEVNYDDKLLEAGPYHEYLKDRVRKNHFSLENLKVFLKTSDLSQTREIHLLHLSSANSNEQQFIDEIQALTGKPTYSAHQLIENNLSLTP